MKTLQELREFERIPIVNKVQVRTNGKMASYALAINISMGGLLLGAAPPMPVGSPCELAISISKDNNGGQAVVAKGIVVRSGEKETAIRFLNTLDRGLYDKVVAHQSLGAGRTFVRSYVDYFKVSQDKNYTGCEQLFGVSRTTFKNVIMTTFSACIALAILPVWLFHHLIPHGFNALKILLSFGYGAIWLAIIQPIVDLAIFRIIKHKNARSPEQLSVNSK